MMAVVAAVVAPAQSSTDTMTVYFRQGKSTVDLSYMGNDTTIDRIKTRLTASDNQPLKSVVIQGAASPEGTIQFNERLSRQRAKTIAEYFNIPDSIVAETLTGSDWKGLQCRVKADTNVPFKAEVEQVIADIIQSPNKACPVDVLKNMHKGVPYRHLYAKHFPYLRRAEIVFVALADVTDDKKDAADMGNAASDETDSTVSVSTLGDFDPDMTDTADTCDTPVSGGTFIGLRTNMLYDVALIPNIGVEIPIGRHFSVGGNWMYAWWKNHARNRHWRIYGGDISARYWFGGGARELNGHHIGLYGTVLLYQVAFGGKGYISGIPGENMTGGKPWIGGGVEYGYSLNVHPRLNIDFSIGVGYTSGEQRDYRMVKDCYVWQSSSRKHWFGPTKAEISLVWKIGRLPQSGKEDVR